MSKFVLLFVAIFVLVGVCFAAEEVKRERRDATEEGNKVIESIKGIFTEDTWNKVVDGAMQFGKDVKKVADDIVQKVSEKSTSTPAA